MPNNDRRSQLLRDIQKYLVARNEFLMYLYTGKDDLKHFRENTFRAMNKVKDLHDLLVSSDFDKEVELWNSQIKEILELLLNTNLK